MNPYLVFAKAMVLITAVTIPLRWVVKRLGFSENFAHALALGVGNYIGRSYLDQHRKGGRA